MGEGESILLVDDDLTLREMYEERLKQEGYVIISASNGEEAIKKAKSERPSLVILDIMMPKVNGIDVMRSLKDDDDTKEIPVIILTALIQEIDKLKGLMGQNDAYLVKSKEMPKDVIEKVRTALKPKTKTE